MSSSFPPHKLYPRNVSRNVPIEHLIPLFRIFSRVKTHALCIPTRIPGNLRSGPACGAPAGAADPAPRACRLQEHPQRRHFLHPAPLTDKHRPYPMAQWPKLAHYFFHNRALTKMAEDARGCGAMPTFWMEFQFEWRSDACRCLAMP